MPFYLIDLVAPPDTTEFATWPTDQLELVRQSLKGKQVLLELQVRNIAFTLAQIEGVLAGRAYVGHSPQNDLASHT